MWFASGENTEIAVAVLFKAGVHGNYAAAIARGAMKSYFDNKERLTEAKPR